MTEERGHISIHAENILPILKRWLYSEKEIFIRELIANGADARLKLDTLALVGEVDAELPEAKLRVTVDQDAGTVTISDNGLGMTADELKRYINQVAFSGLHDFVEKYKDKEDSQQVIGHFGLGFYSSFMVAKKVEISTLSYQAGAKPAHWSCDGSTEFVITPGDRQEIGTDIILHIDDDSREMLNEQMIRNLLHRYCRFVRYPIAIGGEIVNDPRPLWTRSPSELSDEDYLKFFHELFPGAPEPLFWIHLNVDYPFNLRGILYFPRLAHELDASQGEVKLYCNQVYVADNTKELIPEFLTLLKGVIDCPDLPLNVSRSYLQTDPTVRKISEHITKKVSDKLAGMAKTERETFDKYWEDIHPFVKFGMMRDQKFFDRLEPHLVFRTGDDRHLTIAEYQEEMAKNGREEETTIVYTSDETAQASYIAMVQETGVPVVIADTMIDKHFLPFLEMRCGGKYKFVRVDGDLSEILVDKDSAANSIVGADNKTLTDRIVTLVERFLPCEKVKVRAEYLKSSQVPAVLVADENNRRMREMADLGPLAALQANLAAQDTLLINAKHPVATTLDQLSREFNRDEDLKLIVEHLWDLAALQQGYLDKERMRNFVERSATMLGRMGGEPVAPTGTAGTTATTPAPEANT